MAGAITTFLTWPRTPLFRIDGASLLQSPSITETHFTNAGNVAFESAWSVTASIDNRQNYIPLHFTMETVVKSSGTVIGRHLQQQQQQEGQQVDLPARSISQVNIPVYIDYEARQASDPIFSSLRRACVEISHEALQLQFWITIHIAGLNGQAIIRASSQRLQQADCSVLPVEGVGFVILRRRCNKLTST